SLQPGNRWKGRVALVSGASVGIGAAVVKELVQHGMKVVGCARSVDKIEVRYLRIFFRYQIYQKSYRSTDT
uniref:Dehydrogenase/reductase SDR family member 11 n=1 Tax=Astyanax mexicanus TaxID=7994 RepID=A0A8B9JJR9_ASTMX